MSDSKESIGETFSLVEGTDSSTAGYASVRYCVPEFIPNY